MSETEQTARSDVRQNRQDSLMSETEQTGQSECQKRREGNHDDTMICNKTGGVIQLCARPGRERGGHHERQHVLIGPEMPLKYTADCTGGAAAGERRWILIGLSV